MADRKHAFTSPPTTSTVDGASFDAGALSGSSHTAVQFLEVDLVDVEVRGASFADCTFRNARFNASVLIDVAFTNCTFVGCNFFDARLEACKLVGSMFDGCTYELLVVDGGDWSLVGMPGADLRRATFRGVRLREADLTGTRFDGATVRDTDLSGAWMHSATFRGADLRGSDLSALDPLNSDVHDARIDPEQAMTIAATLGMRIG